MPMSDATQTCLDFRLETTPYAKVSAHREQGGVVHHFSLRDPHDHLQILATSLVETHLTNPFAMLNLVLPDWEFYSEPSLASQYYEYVCESRYVDFLPEVRYRSNTLRNPKAPVAEFLIAMNRHIHESFEYDQDATHVNSRLDEVLAKRGGVCQDFAHLFIACARVAGIPARYVSGYLYVGNDASMRGEQATHAWAECLMPNGKWMGFDPTNNLLANDRYVKAHVGLDYSEITPTKGIYTGYRTERLEVSVSVSEVSSQSDVVPTRA